MSPAKSILEKVLNDVDADIREIFLKKDENGEDYAGWIQNPIQTAIEWQRMRIELKKLKHED